MENMRAIIINRSDRKFWYIRYFGTKVDGSVSKFEESTGVKKAEKTLTYMQSKFLPAWLARRIEDSKRTMVKSKEFNYFANIFLKNYEVWEDYQNIEYRTNRILIDFGKKDIRTITKLDIKQYLGPLTNVKTGKLLDKSTKNKYLRVFHGIFDVAVDSGLIDRNITFDIKLQEPKNRDLEEIRPFSKEEVNLLMIRACQTNC
jgi:integrase